MTRASAAAILKPTSPASFHASCASSPFRLCSTPRIHRSHLFFVPSTSFLFSTLIHSASVVSDVLFFLWMLLLLLCLRVFVCFFFERKNHASDPHTHTKAQQGGQTNDPQLRKRGMHTVKKSTVFRLSYLSWLKREKPTTFSHHLNRFFKSTWSGRDLRKDLFRQPSHNFAPEKHTDHLDVEK